MTIVQLEYLLAVVNHGSFSVAAKHCFISQPSMSVQVQNLEDEIGVILLDRSSKPIVPTNAGLPILEQIRNTLAEFYAIKEKVNGLKGALSGKLRLGFIPTVSPYLIPRFIPLFTQKYPDVELEICDMFPHDMIGALNRDMLDVGILSTTEIPENIQATKLFTDKIYVYVSPKHELYERDVIFEKDMGLNIKNLIFQSEGICLRNHRMIMTEALKKTETSYSFSTTSLETLMHTVDATSSITMIPGMAIDYIPREKHSQIKILAHEDAQRTITMAVGRTCMKTALIDAVRETILTLAKQ
jgi:LysR family hydrogen peroxide-inducible transcriptional activator